MPPTHFAWVSKPSVIRRSKICGYPFLLLEERACLAHAPEHAAVALSLSRARALYPTLSIMLMERYSFAPKPKQLTRETAAYL